MNDLFKKGCNLVNYNTYNNIKNGLFASSIAAGVSNILLLFSPSSFGYFGTISSLFYLLYGCLAFSNGSYYTKDVNELRKLYNEFISNYNKLNKDFSFDEPVSVYTMFNFLVMNGYLSKDKDFQKNNCCYDLHPLMGSDVIAGRGVCRHLAAMLSDILNDYGIPSINTVCYTPRDKYLILPTSLSEYSKEDNYNFILKHVESPLERKILIEKLDILEEYGLYLTFSEVPMDREEKRLEKRGNHLITYSLYKDKSYYLDPTLFNMYRLSDSEKGIVVDGYEKKIFIKKNLFYTQNDLTDKEIKKFVGYMNDYQDSISPSLEDSIVSSTIDICARNMDVFDKFYSDNYELYGEITNRLVKIKKKRD